MPSLYVYAHVELLQTRRGNKTRKKHNMVAMQSPTLTVSQIGNKVTPHHEYSKLMYPWDRQVRCNVTQLYMQYWPVPWTGRCQHLAYPMQSRGQWQFTARVHCLSQHCSADTNSDLHDESGEHWIRLSWYYNDCFWMIKNTTSISLLQYNAMQSSADNF